MENLDNVVYKKPVIRQFENVTGHHWFNQLEKRMDRWCLLLTSLMIMVVSMIIKLVKERGCNFSILATDLWENSPK